MFDRSRLTRLITTALASCAVTWALAGSALAMPASDSSSQATAAPAFKSVAGDTNKAPSASTAPAYQPAIGDALKTPDPAQVDRVLNGINNEKNPQPVVDTNDDTGTIALILAIAAILTALGAVTLTMTRTHRPMLGA
jgi:hypothetical protein